jgi:hypothetical protein
MTGKLWCLVSTSNSVHDKSFKFKLKKHHLLGILKSFIAAPWINGRLIVKTNHANTFTPS